jgi:zinc protease
MNSMFLTAHAARILVFAMLAATLTHLTGCGQKPRPVTTAAPTPTPTPNQGQAVETIFAKYAEALGGQEAADRVESYVLKGHFEVTGRPLKLPVEIYVKKPDKSLMVVELPGVGAIRRGRSGGVSWVQTPFPAQARADGDSPNELTEVERDHDLYKAGRIRELYTEVSLEGKARLKGRDVYVVEGRPEKGPAEKMLFDVETGLLLRWDIVRRAPGQPNVFARVYLDDYREVDGLKVPFTVRYYFEPRELVLRLDEVKHGVALDDSLFEKPAGR